MAEITASMVKELREKSGAPMMDCKKALTEANGDLEQAIVVLRKRGMASAAKKATRSTSEGVVTSYIHAGGKIGVLLEVNCESDFVARTCLLYTSERRAYSASVAADCLTVAMVSVASPTLKRA